jgi:cysteine desulfurase
MKVIYLDNNATTLSDPILWEDKDIQEILSSPMNPSSIHTFGRKAKSHLVYARKTISEYLNVTPESIIFTSGATEGLNLCIRGLIRPFTHIISSKIEHPAVLKTLLHLQQKGCSLTLLDPKEKGYIEKKEIENALQQNTSLIVLSYANSETGVKNPIQEIAELTSEKKITFVVDGAQWLGKDEMQIFPGITAISFSGHKIHALQGSGFVYLNPLATVEPLLLGGPQEYQKRAGTQNLLAIVSLAKMIEKLKKEDKKYFAHMRSLRDHFEKNLIQEFDDIQINGMGERICNTCNLYFPNIEAEVLFKNLDLLGICSSLGSACSSGSIEPSKVLIAMGYSQNRALESMRFSFSRMNTFEEIDDAIKIIKEALQKQKNL